MAIGTCAGQGRGVVTGFGTAGIAGRAPGEVNLVVGVRGSRGHGMAVDTLALAVPGRRGQVFGVGTNAREGRVGVPGRVLGRRRIVGRAVAVAQGAVGAGTAAGSARSAGRAGRRWHCHRPPRWRPRCYPSHRYHFHRRFPSYRWWHRRSPLRSRRPLRSRPQFRWRRLLCSRCWSRQRWSCLHCQGRHLSHWRRRSRPMARPLWTPSDPLLRFHRLPASHYSPRSCHPLHCLRLCRYFPCSRLGMKQWSRMPRGLPREQTPANVCRCDCS
jgi:hypothetical protein